MTHVSIRMGGKYENGKSVEVMVDGTDITSAILRDGFGVTFGSAPEEKSILHLQIIADELDIDLPDSVIDAVKGDAA